MVQDVVQPYPVTMVGFVLVYSVHIQHNVKNNSKTTLRMCIIDASMSHCLCNIPGNKLVLFWVASVLKSWYSWLLHR